MHMLPVLQDFYFVSHLPAFMGLSRCKCLQQVRAELLKFHVRLASAARASPRVVLALGLAATAAVNIAFGFGASYAWFIACWGINGLLQGMGAPACARCANRIALPADD